jgi:uncharacterized protein
MLKYFALLFLSFSAFAQIPVPEHGGVWVHDEANVLSAQAKAELETILKAERDSTSNQIAVLIVPSLEGDDISRYGTEVFEKWKLGQAKKDNGVLFLVSINDRKMRIEVGYGLEGILTDAISSRIDRNEVAPRFRVGDFDGGVKAAVGAIIQVIKGEYKNEEPVQRRRKKGTPISTIIVLLVIIFLASRRKGGGGGGGGGYWAAGAAGALLGRGFGGSSSSWGGGGGSDFGGGGGSGGGGSSDSW